MQLLRARSRIYQEARGFQIAQLVVVLVVPVLSAVVGIIVPAARPHVGAIALAATFLDALWLDRAQRTRLKLAARISEIFDCGLFGLPWNEFVAGPRPDAMTIAAAAGAWKDGDEKLRDWYGPHELGLAPLHLGRLICQQSNLWYDSKLRRRVGAALAIAGVALATILAIMGVVLQLPFTDFVLTVVTPAAPILIWTAREHHRQRDTAEALETIKANADALWNKAVTGTCGHDECAGRSREFQDAIFSRRASSPLNMPLVYNLLRSSMERSMKSGAAEMLRQVSDNLRTN